MFIFLAERMHIALAERLRDVSGQKHIANLNIYLLPELSENYDKSEGQNRVSPTERKGARWIKRNRRNKQVSHVVSA